MNLWTDEQKFILKTMREAGLEWPEISMATGHPISSCQTRATIDGVTKLGKDGPVMHAGLAPELKGSRGNGRPTAGKPCIRNCINQWCRREFRSSDRVNNQICPRCKGLSISPDY
jgi:hypothetical protein